MRPNNIVDSFRIWLADKILGKRLWHILYRAILETADRAGHENIQRALKKGYDLKDEKDK